MRFARVLGIAMLSTLLTMVFMPAIAQEETLPILILPINNASFLPGAKFDFRVEVHTRNLPDNFAVTLDGTPAAEFFGAEGTMEDWEFGGRVTRFNGDGVAAEDFALDSVAGEYYLRDESPLTVEVADGVATLTDGTDTSTLVETDTVGTYTLTEGAMDGETVVLGFNADGVLTGLSIGETNYGRVSGSSFPTQSSSVVWRDVTLSEMGDVTVEVTAGGTTESVVWDVRTPAAGTARNVILFIADGMTVPLITAARAARGISEGLPTNPLAMDTFKTIGTASTSSVDSLMADSANTASALNTGHIGSVNATGIYADTSPNRLDDPKVETLAEMLRRTRGMSIGIVATSDYSDATPAAVWAHGRDRSDANRAVYALSPLDGGLLPEVIMGGGARRLLPQSAEGSRRTDDRDGFAEYEAAGYTIVTSATELFEALAAGTAPERILGVFVPNDLNVWLDRNVYTDNLGDFTDQPGLVDMTLGALEVLNTNENGFYLQVEAASVDKQIHPLDQERALSDLIEFDQAVAAAIAWAEENAPDTLIIVTADHGHGYDVYGTVKVEQFNAADNDADRRAAIDVYNAAGYPTYTDENGDGFPEWDATVTFAGVVNNHPDYTENFQVSEVSRVPAIAGEGGIIGDNPDDDANGIFLSGNLDLASNSGVHTLQDVPVFAMGPGAECFGGHYHQREVFFCMAGGIGLDVTAEDGKAQ